MSMAKRSDAASDLIETVRTLVPAIEAAAIDIDRDRRLPADLVKALQAAGLFKLLVPRAYGGGEASLPDFAAIIEEIARADASTAWCLCQNAGVTRMSAFLPPTSATEIFGQPDLALAWGQGRARAIKVDGGYRLTGEWAWVSGIRHATWLGCQDCPVTDEIGEPLRNADGTPERRIFVFPATAAEIDDVWQVSGLRGTGSDTFRVTDLFVPEARSPGTTPQVDGALYVFNTTNIFSAGFASAALGVARAALDAFEDLATTKSPRGVSGVLREQQSIHIAVGEAEATLRSARAYLREVLDRAWLEVCEDRDMTPQTRVEMRLASTFAFQCASRVVDRVYYLAGTSAIAQGGAIERRFRDMHAMTQHIQGREDHFEPAGQFFLGIEPSRQWL